MIPVVKVLAIATCVLLSACANMTPQTQDALVNTSVRIAARHFIVDSPRALERVKNVRIVGTALLATVNEETTVDSLRAETERELQALGVDPLVAQDVTDLLNLFEAALEGQLANAPDQGTKVVRIRDFIQSILNALPVTT